MNCQDAAMQGRYFCIFSQRIQVTSLDSDTSFGLSPDNRTSIMVGRVGLEPTMFHTSRIYSPLPSPFGYRPIYNMAGKVRFELTDRESEKPIACFPSRDATSCEHFPVLAERVGFEPTVLCSTSDFRADTINHSDTSPCWR